MEPNISYDVLHYILRRSNSYTSDSTYMKEPIPVHFHHRPFRRTEQLEFIS